ncbi:MAG: cyclic-di-AMP receptor [Clostridia bacterium]|nr:cyclic-di-AMP receptor [Clostridia bacterium]
MKLIIAIVQDEDSGRLITGLMEKGFGVTKLATTGGFLKAGNTTLMIGVEDEGVSDAVRTIETVCKSRKQMMTAHSTIPGGQGSGFTSFPMEVTVGGATLFVLSVDQFLKV